MSSGRRRLVVVVGASVVVLSVIVATAGLLLTDDSKHAVAYFPTTKSLYEGDNVAVLGVEVGQIDSIEPQGDRVRVAFHYDADVKVPARAKAVIISPTLVSNRYIQLTPAYSGGPVLEDSATIPLARTAVPTEFDEIKKQVTRLARALGPEGANRDGALSRAISRAAELSTANGESQGENFHAAIAKMSRAMQTIAQSRGDIFGTVRNLDVFTRALVSSRRQIVKFQQRLADVSALLRGNSRELSGALESLGTAARNVRNFVKDNRQGLAAATEKLDRTADVLVQERLNIAGALHIAPQTLANFYSIYDPTVAALTGQLVIENIKAPAIAVCATASAMAAEDSSAATDVCREYLNPVMKYFAMQHPPVGVRPITRPDGVPRADPAPKGDSDEPEPSPARPNFGSLPQTVQNLLTPGGE